MLIVQNWITFNDSASTYIVSGIANGAYQNLSPVHTAAYPPQSVVFNGSDKIRITYYNNAGGYWAVAPIMIGGF